MRYIPTQLRTSLEIKYPYRYDACRVTVVCRDRFMFRVRDTCRVTVVCRDRFMFRVTVMHRIRVV